MVIRRYAVFGDYDRGEKARREFETFRLVRRHGLPAPDPLYLDQAGTLLGVPGIVTTFVPGRLVESPVDPKEWARSLAQMLARIHSVRCDSTARQFLLDANREAIWFLRSGIVPDFMRAHPQGETLWRTAHALFPHLRKTPRTLVHLDYWPGNVLWDDRRIAAVVDWEEAAHGDPAIDVGYCRMHIVLSGMFLAAEEFLRVYEAEVGRHVTNLGFWELAAAVRPMNDPEGWSITEPPRSERLMQFLDSARGRAAGA